MSLPRCAVVGLATLLPTLACLAPAQARRHAPKPPTPAQASPVLTLHEAIALAWARAPQRSALAARQNVAGARYLAGSALFPNAPTAQGSYVNDKIAGSNYNYITTTVTLSTPVWLPGEGTALENAASAQGAAVESQVLATRYRIAGAVLDAVVAATDARNAQTVARRRLETNQALARDLHNRLAVGEASQADALAADAETATAQISLAQAESQLAAAQASLAELTGSQAVPTLLVPGPAPLAASALSGAEHPLLREAAAQVQSAVAEQRLTHIQDRDDPEIGLQGTNEKQPGTRWDTRFGVVMTFHFATEARNAPRFAEAAERVTQAQVQLELLRRRIEAEIAGARVALVAADRAATAASRGAAELETRRVEIAHSWQLGETPFIELVRANALAFDAASARDKARLAQAAASIRLRMAEGALP